MSTRYPGGIITKSPATPTGPYDTGAAPGIWTLEQQLQYQKQGVWPTAGLQPNYIEDVFSTYLYTGNRPTGQTITNGIDLSTKGGLVWLKDRTAANSNGLFDSARGISNGLYSNSTSAQFSYASGITSFNTTGFTLGSDNGGFINVSGNSYASWTFRKQEKFFDVVTYTGNGTARTIAHNLGSVPGCIIVKATSGAGNWYVYHRSLGNTQEIRLNQTAASAGGSLWDSTTPTSTVFSLGASSDVNSGGTTYVAYLFAHNAGGFGASGADNVISCGSYTGPTATVTLGYEPQWIMIKNTTSADNWEIYDNMRGLTGVSTGQNQYLLANTAGAETSVGASPIINSTGFTASGVSANTYIYIAIRRGPMRTPTSGTDVYKGIARNGTGTDTTVTGVGFTPDLVLTRDRGGASGYSFTSFDRLRGANNFISTNATSAENGSVTNALTGFDVMNGYKVGTDATLLVVNDGSIITECFRRAPGFFDEVCYTGTGSTRTVTHNLAAVPELIIVKKRNASGTEWATYSAATGASKFLNLNSTIAATTPSPSTGYWNSTSPTSTVFSLGNWNDVNQNGATFVAYLFASCPGVSKVGSYTGTGTTKQIDCGFTGGARFVLIKRTDSTGDWYVWDSARGIVAGNDPYLLLNSTAAEVTNTDYIDTYSAGFEISSTAPAAINANGGTFIFLAIA